MSDQPPAIHGLEYYMPPIGRGAPSATTRVIRAGSDVYVHHLAFGSDSPVEVTPCGSTYAADTKLNLVGQRCRREGMEVVFSWASHDPLGEHDDPEQVFLGAWDSYVNRMLGSADAEPRRCWVLFRGLLEAARLEHGSATALAYLRSEAHFIDSGRDVIVARASRVPELSDQVGTRSNTHYTGTRSSAYLVALYQSGCVHGAVECAPCAGRVPELVAYLARDRELETLSWDDRLLLGATAYRLTAVGSR